MHQFRLAQLGTKVIRVFHCPTIATDGVTISNIQHPSLAKTSSEPRTTETSHTSVRTGTWLWLGSGPCTLVPSYSALLPAAVLRQRGRWPPTQTRLRRLAAVQYGSIRASQDDAGRWSQGDQSKCRSRASQACCRNLCCRSGQQAAGVHLAEKRKH